MTSTGTSKTTPRIYVASLSDYNVGRLYGTWLDAVDVAEAQEGISAMLKASPEGHAEEVAVHDFEGFGSYRIHEYEDLALICAIGVAIQEHGTLFAEYLGHVGTPKEVGDVVPLVERFQESYQGEFDNLADWAEQFLEDTGALNEVPVALRSYIDVERWARDQELNGDIFTVGEGAVHVFWNQ